MGQALFHAVLHILPICEKILHNVVIAWSCVQFPRWWIPDWGIHRRKRSWQGMRRTHSHKTILYQHNGVKPMQSINNYVMLFYCTQNDTTWGNLELGTRSIPGKILLRSNHHCVTHWDHECLCNSKWQDEENCFHLHFQPHQWHDPQQGCLSWKDYHLIGKYKRGI